MFSERSCDVATYKDRCQTQHHIVKELHQVEAVPPRVEPREHETVRPNEGNIASGHHEEVIKNPLEVGKS